jgi:vacuolar-type H+-ATPase subunit I/STV1
MENSLNNLDGMTTRQLSDLRKNLEKARDDKLAELKRVEAELRTVIERLKRVQSAYYATLQREEACSKGK